MRSRKGLGARYWKLWTASVVSNFGDGVSLIAYPWLASAITRDGFKLALVVLATRAPWLVFSLFAGVLTDRFDRKKLMVGMDVVRMVLTAGVAMVVLTAGAELSTPADIAAGRGAPPPNETLLLGLVMAAAFLLGMAEVLRDNSAQTFVPAIVDKDLLEQANGRMWAAEMVANQFAGPPAAGLLIAVGLALPFFVDAGTFAVAAGLVFLIGGEFRAEQDPGPRPTMRRQMKEGFRWLWSHSLFRPLAIVLGVINALSTMAFATLVLFVQEVLGLGATGFGILTAAGAAGGLVGSLTATRIATGIGKGPSLFATLLVGAVSLTVIGLSSSAVVVWVMFAVEGVFVVVWNVITVSLRQRTIPDRLLGRVNSVYRFFGWGMMTLGAPLGGALVSMSQPVVGREWALRLPLLVAGALHVVAFVYALPRLNSARIAATEATVAGASDEGGQSATP